ncbi:MFS transporter [Bradyrhizobium sp. USDA 4502]
MIARRVVIALGLAQLISWGATYYLVGGFGEQIAADLGWSRDIVYGGFAAALLVMGVTSPLAGRWVDRSGGRQVMVAGAAINALGCAGLAVSHQIGSYFASWIVLGLGMRLTLYDAAFAALARIGGPEARRAMSGITLLGGLAATVFWPLGHALSDHFGWRIAVLVYAGIALLTIPLHLLIPNQRFAGVPGSAVASRQPRAVGRRQLAAASGLYAVTMTGANFLNAGMSAHMIAVLTGLGLTVTVAVWIATLRGIGQSAARLCEVLFGVRIDPLALNLMACLIMPLSFIAGLFSGSAREMGIAFALLYGACNGILTITRGTLPLILFDHRSYGTLVGRLIVPSFILPAAAAPLIYAIVIDRFGDASALYLSTGLALVTLLAAILLKLLFPPPLAAAKQ